MLLTVLLWVVARRLMWFILLFQVVVRFLLAGVYGVLNGFYSVPDG